LEPISKYGSGSVSWKVKKIHIDRFNTRSEVRGKTPRINRRRPGKMATYNIEHRVGDHLKGQLIGAGGERKERLTTGHDKACQRLTRRERKRKDVKVRHRSKR
jgi:hypothetical protein